MWYSIEYDIDVFDEIDAPEQEPLTEFRFDKFMDDILIRENKHDAAGHGRGLDAATAELERRRRLWRERYVDSPYSRMIVKNK